jgi:hypothetical protein
VYAPNLHIAESLPSKSVQSPVQEVLVQQGWQNPWWDHAKDLTDKVSHP